MLVLGTGDAAERLLRELAHSSEWSVIGLLGENDSRVGHELRGVKILGQIAELPAWATRLSVRKAIVAMPEATQVERRRAMETAVQAKLSVLTVPSLEDVLSGKVAVSQVRQVELEDLLGRDPVQLAERWRSVGLAGRRGGTGQWRGRVNRFGTRSPDGSFSATPAGVAGTFRIPALPDRTGIPDKISRDAHCLRGWRCQGRCHA